MGTSVPAGRLQLGDELVGENDKVIKLMNITTENLKGFVAPLTASGTLFVEGVSASAYVEVTGGQKSKPSSFLHSLSHFGTAVLRWFAWAERSSSKLQTMFFQNSKNILI